MNQGYVCEQNKGGSEKIFSGNKPTAKILPQADNLKQFRAPSESDKSVMDRDHSGVSAPKFKN